jgi:hypothetical protein
VRGTRWKASGAVVDPGGLEVSKDAASVDDAAVAFGGGVFLVTWADWRDGGYRIYAARVTSTGVVLDPTAISIAAALPGRAPAVAFDGQNFLIVWAPQGGSVYGVRLSPSGSILDQAPVRISNAPGYDPAIAFDGTDYLAVWGTDVYGGDIAGARVSPAGTVLDPAGIPISSHPGDEGGPHLAFDGANFLVAWAGWQGTSVDVYGARVSPSGAVLDPNGLVIATMIDGSPSVAFGGTNYLVVWEDLCCGVSGTRVTPSGSILDPGGIAIKTEAGGVGAGPVVAFNGVNFVAAWNDVADGVDIYGARINQAGVVLDRSPGILLSRAVPPPPKARCIVPRVVGLRLSLALKKIRRAHCAVGRVRRVRSGRIGRVVSQSPRAGVKKPKGFRVRLAVGTRSH